MADDLPSNAQFRLPEDLTSLAQMRDQLSDYLNTLERNTDSVNGWLAKNQNKIIVGHHQLSRAVDGKDEKAALAALQTLGDASGFVLSLQDFSARGAKAFGAKSAFVKAVDNIARGVPAAILEDLPELTMPDPNAPLPQVVAPPAPPQIAPEPEDSKKWWKPASWFQKGGAEEPNTEEESQRRIDEIKRNWKLVRSELISLQSDRHYYIDSFMEWIGETLEPEKGVEDPAAAKLMEKYQNPQYVIDLAVQDYAEVIDVKARQLREKALGYSDAAALIDQQRIAEFVASLPKLFPKPETNEARQQKDLLLQDFGVVSFAELALDRVKSRADQFLLLDAALKFEPEFKLKNNASKLDIFERILKETTAKDPLDVRALKITLKKLRSNGSNDTAELIGLKVPGKSVFERLAERFDANLNKVRAAFDELLDGIDAPPRNVQLQMHSVNQAIRDKDVRSLASALQGIETTGSSQAFKGLWALSYPGRSLLDDITAVAATKKDLALLTDRALSAGLIDEFKINSNAANASAPKVIKFFNEQVMQGQGDFTLTTARRLLGTAFANGGLDLLRKELTKSGGWLEQTVASPLPPDEKSKWVAALLEPFASDIVRSNILAEAAKSAKDPAAAKTLNDMEANLAGSNIRLDDGRIMTNLDRVANIWYAADTGTLRFTVSGVGHVLANDVSAPMAQEILSHIQRKAPGFEAEYDGLYNPKNLDRIVTNPQGTLIYWQNRNTVLNVPDATVAALHKHADFMHVTGTDGNIQSVNLKSIALLQPLSDGTHLLVDKFGDVQILAGKVQLAAKAPLLDLGGTYFNPANAGLLSLNAEKNTIDFRCESNDFENLIESAAPGKGNYFYSVELGSKAEFKKVEDAVAANPALASPGGASKALFFNIERLGYLMHTEERESGFNCRKFGHSKKPGFISADADFAEAIYQGLSANKELFTVGNIITHKSVIDDAYYNSDKQRFYVLVGDTVLQAACDEREAYDALKKLSKEPGFTVVGATTIKNPAPAGVGTVELPADIVNLGRTALQYYSDAQDKTFLVAENERFFNIGLDKHQSRQLFDILEQDGLKAAKAATALNAWTQKLQESAANLPALTLRATPSLTDTSREYLLQQVLGKESETRPMPEPKKDFSIVTAPLRTNDRFDYPPRAQKKAAAVTKQPRP